MVLHGRHCVHRGQDDLVSTIPTRVHHGSPLPDFMPCVFLGKPFVLCKSHHILIWKEFVSEEIIETPQEIEAICYCPFPSLLGLLKLSHISKNSLKLEIQLITGFFF